MDPIPSDYANMVKLYMVRYVLGGNHRVLRGLFHLVRRLKRSR